MAKKDNILVSVRLDKDIKAWLDEESKRCYRTLSDQLRLIVYEYIAHQKPVEVSKTPR